MGGQLTARGPVARRSTFSILRKLSGKSSSLKFIEHFMRLYLFH